MSHQRKMITKICDIQRELRNAEKQFSDDITGKLCSVTECIGNNIRCHVGYVVNVDAERIALATTLSELVSEELGFYRPLIKIELKHISAMRVVVLNSQEEKESTPSRDIPDL